MKENYINCSGNLVDLSSPVVMGILNATPDSFYDGGKNNSVSEALKKAEEILIEGGKIIDVGAFSTRPNGENISQTEEENRLFPVLTEIKKHFPDTIISVDTFRAEIAEKSIEKYGADMINDISGGNFDDKMFDTIARLKVPYIIMHLQGTIENMHQSTFYKDFMRDIILYFSERINKLKQLGVNDIIIDPGFGFSKTLEQNYKLMKNLHQFEVFEEALLVGISRKSMIYKALNTKAAEALNGTTVLNTLALQGGAKILRVHDVKQAVEAIDLVGRVQ